MVAKKKERKKNFEPNWTKSPPSPTPPRFFQILVVGNFSFQPNYSVQPIDHLYNQVTCQLARFFQECLEPGTLYQILDDRGGVMDN